MWPRGVVQLSILQPRDIEFGAFKLNGLSAVTPAKFSGRLWRARGAGKESHVVPRRSSPFVLTPGLANLMNSTYNSYRYIICSSALIISQRDYMMQSNFLEKSKNQ